MQSYIWIKLAWSSLLCAGKIPIGMIAEKGSSTSPPLWNVQIWLTPCPVFVLLTHFQCYVALSCSFPRGVLVSGGAAALFTIWGLRCRKMHRTPFSPNPILTFSNSLTFHQIRHWRGVKDNLAVQRAKRSTSGLCFDWLTPCCDIQRGRQVAWFYANIFILFFFPLLIIF